MKKQLTFSLISDELAQAKTSRKGFLEKIERIIPFDKWIEIIRPCYYIGEHGNNPYSLELMLRIYLLQNLYDPSDVKVMNEIIDSRAFKDKKRDKDAHSVKKRQSMVFWIQGSYRR